jgi:hypothetical protein
VGIWWAACWSGELLKRYCGEEELQRAVVKVAQRGTMVGYFMVITMLLAVKRTERKRQNDETITIVTIEVTGLGRWRCEES